LLIITAFFAALSIIIPSSAFALEQFLSASDTILAKQIYSTMEEQNELFLFLGNNSKKEFEFVPAQKIILKTQGNNFEISSQQKTFSLTLRDNQISKEKEFTKKFKILLKKENEKIIIEFEEVSVT